MRTMWILGVVLFFGGSCLASPIIYEVPVDGSTVIVPINIPGDYSIYSWGLWQWGGSSTITIADPEWMHYAANEAFGFDGWQEVWDTHPWFSYSYDCNDLKINDQFIDWEGLQSDGSYQAYTYSGEHQYRVNQYLNNDVSFRIFDTDYHDNIGSVSVKVEPVAVPEAPEWALFIAGAVVIWLYYRKRRR